MPAPTLTTVIDDFAGTGALGAQWSGTQIQSTTATALSRSSDVLLRGGAANNTWVSADYGADCEFQYTIAAVPADGKYVASFLRGASFGTASWEAYYLVLIQNAADATWSLRKRIAGTATTMQTPTSAKLGVGDKYALQAVGSDLQMWFWRAADATPAWAQIGTTQVDTSLAAAGKHGVEMDSSDTLARLDNLIGGTLTSGTTFTKTGLGVIGP